MLNNTLKESKIPSNVFTYSIIINRIAKNTIEMNCICYCLKILSISYHSQILFFNALVAYADIQYC